MRRKDGLTIAPAGILKAVDLNTPSYAAAVIQGLERPAAKTHDGKAEQQKAAKGTKLEVGPRPTATDRTVKVGRQHVPCVVC